MALIPTLTDYTDKDFDALRLRLRNLIRSVFPEWTDFNVANFGNILVELFAHTGDVLTFYQDNQARQARIATASQRKAMLGLVKLIGFKPATATAATAGLTITLPTPPTGSVTFSKGTFIKTEEVTDPIRYQLLADAVIGAGANPATVSVVAENSESEETIFTSTNAPDQSVVLGATPYIDGATTITAGNGAYAQVDNFLDSGPSDRHFTVSVDQNDRATVRFGNGVNGATPTGTVTIDYKIGGGAKGRVEQGKLKVFEQTTWTDALGNNVTPAVTNPTASVGGTDRQSVEQIRERGPATLRALSRSVAREDFEINALRLPSVARALMLTKNEDESVEENCGSLYIVPVGGGAPTQQLLDDVLTQVTVAYPCTLTFAVTVFGAPYKVANINTVIFFRPGVNKAVVARAVRANLAAFFNPQNADGTSNPGVDFGAHVRDSAGEVSAELALSDVMNIVRDTVGVRKLSQSPDDFLINGAHSDLQLLPKEFPQLGTVQILDGDTGTVL